MVTTVSALDPANAPSARRRTRVRHRRTTGDGAAPGAGRARSRIRFDSADPPVVAHFWAALTGHHVAANEPELIRLEGDGYGLGDLVFVEVDGWKRAPNRVHLELVVEDVEQETRRAIELGATPVEEREARGEYRLVLRDPEGNEFSLIRYAA